jgi:phosphoserine aminotransferase
MSSDIFSRPIDVSKYICIYGGAQKNLAPAGTTFVIVKDEALNKVSRYIPTMLNYQTHIEGGSMFNTPPVLPIYSAMLTLRWIKANGGVEEMQRRAKKRAELLYGEIDRNKMFRATVADPEDRSYMNICFVMNDEYKDLEAEFMKFATERGMVGIKGHRSVGGFRASCYNAMPLESVQALVDCMQEFEKLH